MSDIRARYIQDMSEEERKQIYNRGSREPNFHIKNFFIHYQCLLNKPFIVNKGRKEYALYLDRISKDIQKMCVDFSKNLLFVCNKNIPRDVFLVGLSDLPHLHSIFLCNTGKLMDIYYGNMRADNPMVQEDEIMASEQSITQDIMLLEMSKVTDKTHSDRIISSTIMSRANRTNNRKELLRNWIFYTGYMAEFKHSYPMLYNVYTDSANQDTFQIVDATSLFSFLQGIRSDTSFNPTNLGMKSDTVIDKHSNNCAVNVIQGQINCITNNQELEDMY